MSFNPATFWKDRPANIHREEWPFHPLNKQRLPECAREVLRLIIALARPKTWFHQSWLAQKVERTERWIREILNRLEKIGLILVDRGPYQNHYAPISAPATESRSGETSGHEEKNKFPEWIVKKYREYRQRTGRKITIDKWWPTVRDIYVGG